MGSARAPGMAGQARGAGKIAYLIEPRFSGGTSAAVAAELAVARGAAGQVRVHGFRARMFAERPPAPVLEDRLDRLGLPLDWDSAVIRGDLVILHNPSFLKFDGAFARRIVARHLVLVTHENFLRPGGAEAFDVAHCLGLIDRASFALRKTLAPVSAHNRETVATWLDSRQRRADRAGGWRMLDDDWFNICDTDLIAPVARPRDRRGRLSRPSAEKFPALADLDLCFPPGAECNLLLGADGLAEAARTRPHWTLYPFNGLAPAEFYDRIDFMVHFVAPTWSESFGRVLAEAVAAGKVVISDARTAAMLPGAVIAARPDEVDAVIARHVADPDLYQGQVRSAQARLAAYSPARFADLLGQVLADRPGGGA